MPKRKAKRIIRNKNTNFTCHAWLYNQLCLETKICRYNSERKTDVTTVTTYFLTMAEVFFLGLFHLPSSGPWSCAEADEGNCTGSARRPGWSWSSGLYLTAEPHIHIHSLQNQSQPAQHQAFSTLILTDIVKNVNACQTGVLCHMQSTTTLSLYQSIIVMSLQPCWGLCEAGSRHCRALNESSFNMCQSGIWW